MSVLQYEGLQIGLPQVYRARQVVEPDDGQISVQLAVSRDTVHWQRVADRQPFLAPGEKEFELCAVMPTAPVVKGDEIFVYYGGYNFLPTDDPHRRSRYPDCFATATDDWKPVRAVGLAKLRLDGWVSLDADDRPGEVVTKEVVIEGRRLVINGNAAAGGLAVEVMGPDERPLEGFALADCQPMRADDLRYEVRWRGNTTLEVLKGRTVRLRLVLSNTKLFSFQLCA